jgi:hypothetical protein
MIERLIIAGGRGYQLNDQDWEFLDSLGPVGEVVSGCCRGADSGGEGWAKARGIPVQTFPADWSLGRKAGPLRNAQMAEYATAVVLFPGGAGTRSMRSLAIQAGLQVIPMQLRGTESGPTCRASRPGSGQMELI